jgi:hypothetical protein
MGVLALLVVVALLGASLVSGAVMTALVVFAGVVLVMAVVCLMIGLAVNIAMLLVKIALTYLLACALRWVVRKGLDIIDGNTDWLQSTSTEQLEKIATAAGGILAVWYMFIH